MIYADGLENTLVQDDTGRWHLAKPITDSSIFRRLFDAWKVLIGDYVAVKFWVKNEKVEE